LTEPICGLEISSSMQSEYHRTCSSEGNSVVKWFGDQAMWVVWLSLEEQ